MGGIDNGDEQNGSHERGARRCHATSSFGECELRVVICTVQI